MTLRKTLAATAATLVLAACSGASGSDGGLSVEQLADLDPATMRDEPVMFSVTDADSEVILFGTFHALPRDVDWQTDTLDAAIARSDEAWFELPKNAQNDPALGPLVGQLAMSDTPLSDRVSPELYSRLEAKITELGLPQMGMPMEAINQMQPWFASLTLSQIMMMQQGFDPTSGAEAVLEPKVAALGRRSFETAEQQLRIFANMDEAAQVEMLEQTLDQLDDDPDLLSRMASSWATGDVDMLENEVIVQAKADGPELYDAVFTQRNAAWTDTLVEELEGSGTDFVAVGAGHLLGPDSVPVMLAKRGYTVRVLTAEGAE